MSVAQTLRQLGGFATRRQLRAAHSRRAIARAERQGEIKRTGRNRYLVPEIDEHRTFAHQHNAVLSHVSAALAHGWKVVWVPELPWLVVCRGRKVSAELRAAAHISYAETTDAERAEGVTAPLRTVIDCARVLPRYEALAIADSALRSGMVTREDLLAEAATAKGQGARQIRWVAEHATPRAANPFESVLRGIGLDVRGLRLIAQHTIAESGLFAVGDLADPDLRLVLEADSYEFHASKAGFIRDVRRYTELVIHGWAVLRFAWIDVMRNPEWVRWALETYLATRLGDRDHPAMPADTPYIRDRAS